MCTVTYSHMEGDQEGEGDAGNKRVCDGSCRSPEGHWQQLPWKKEGTCLVQWAVHARKNKPTKQDDDLFFSKIPRCCIDWLFIRARLTWPLPPNLKWELGCIIFTIFFFFLFFKKACVFIFLWVWVCICASVYVVGKLASRPEEDTRYSPLDPTIPPRQSLSLNLGGPSVFSASPEVSKPQLTSCVCPPGRWGYRCAQVAWLVTGVLGSGCIAMHSQLLSHLSRTWLSPLCTWKLKVLVQETYTPS